MAKDKYDKYPYKYSEILVDEGISESRIDDLCWALYELHESISKLDCHNIKKFLKISLGQRINEYAEAEDLMQISDIYDNC